VNLAPLAERFGADRRLRVPTSTSIGPLTALLEQLRDLITLMPTPMYLAQPAARVSGSVGAHVRHCLDHVSAFAAALAGEDLSYDRRLRGTTVETDPRTAVNEIERLFVRLDRAATTPLDRPLTLTALVEAGRPPVTMRSTLARELTFVVHHTIHHCALIALLVEWQGGRVPYGFGLAPSTAAARASA
jgi:uncharacterized damage-inducible protein DinB